MKVYKVQGKFVGTDTDVAVMLSKEYEIGSKPEAIEAFLEDFENSKLAEHLTVGKVWASKSLKIVPEVEFEPDFEEELEEEEGEEEVVDEEVDDGVEVGTRNLRVALRKLRKLARQGAAEEFEEEVAA